MTEVEDVEKTSVEEVADVAGHVDEVADVGKVAAVDEAAGEVNVSVVGRLTTTRIQHKITITS